MKILVTGGTGLIGAHLTQELTNEDHDVTIFDSLTNYTTPADQSYHVYLQKRFENLIDNSVERIRGDVRYKSEVRRTISDVEPDRIVHLAALPIADLCNEHSEEAMSSIVMGTVNVLEAIRDVSTVDRFVYASSSMVYGDFEYRPADESHPKNPKGVYGGTKLSGEVLSGAFSRRFGFDHTIVRPSAVYGPTDVNRRVVQIFVENALQGKPLKLHNGGHHKLDFTYVEDTAKGIAKATVHPEAANEIFNITRGEGRSIRELAQIISEEIDDVTIVEESIDNHRPVRGALDITKAEKKLDYSPDYSLEEGVAQYIDFVQSIGEV